MTLSTTASLGAKGDSFNQVNATVGIVGCGNIADSYVLGMRRFPELRIAECASRSTRSADGLAQRTGIRAFATVDHLLDDPAIDIVVNLTPPLAHGAITQAALRAGKHVYVEKPIAADVADAGAQLEFADSSGLLVGCAPDTFLGSCGQTARRAIDDGLIGTPLGCAAFIRHTRAETWHPDPTFLFQPGGGPVQDLGPYSIAALVNLLGPIHRVSSFARIGSRYRMVTAPDRRVDKIEVATPTHFSASLEFTNDAIGTLIASFDIWNTRLPFIEIYGDEGTMALGDPDEYDHPVHVRRRDDHDWHLLPAVVAAAGQPGSASQRLRGVGVLDLARAIHGQPHRASGQLGLHVLESLAALAESSTQMSAVEIQSTVSRPPALAPSLRAAGQGPGLPCVS